MTETFDNFGDDHVGDDHDGDHGHVPEHDESGYVPEPAPAHEPAGHDEPPPTEPTHPAPIDDAPTLSDDAPGAPEAVWQQDPAADEDLRAWLDDPHPVLDAPPGFDQRLAEELAADAARQGASTEDLVRTVLARLNDA